MGPGGGAARAAAPSSDHAPLRGPQLPQRADAAEAHCARFGSTPQAHAGRELVCTGCRRAAGGGRAGPIASPPLTLLQQPALGTGGVVPCARPLSQHQQHGEERARVVCARHRKQSHGEGARAPPCRVGVPGTVVGWVRDPRAGPADCKRSCNAAPCGQHCRRWPAAGRTRGNISSQQGILAI